MVCEVAVEACNFRSLNFEFCCTHLLSPLLLDEDECAAFTFGYCESRAVCGNEHAVLELPQLCFVRTVVLANLHNVAVGTQSVVGDGVDDAPTARQLR